MCERKQPIGVFDSGIGGLTVLEQLIKKFPNENFIYVADQGSCPYGTKSPCEIAERVESITSFLLALNVKAVVIACNTASVHIERAKSRLAKERFSLRKTRKSPCLRLRRQSKAGHTRNFWKNRE